MTKRLLTRVWTALCMGMAAVAMLLTACSESELVSNADVNPLTPEGVKADEMRVTVTADVPTAVLSTFDENSMGAALVRRLSNTTSEITSETKMILIKGEDILSLAPLEWAEATKIYLRGGYIAVEKPHDAHMVEMMEQVSMQLELTAHDILTEDDGSGFVITVTPPAGQQAPANAVNAEAARFKTRIANIEARAATRAGNEAKPVAEMVIFSRNGFYHYAPFQNRTITVGGSNVELSADYTPRTSGLMADGAARWLNNKSAATRAHAATRANAVTRADGSSDAINEIMSASEEQTYQADVTSMTFHEAGLGLDFFAKHNAYTEVCRVWGVHNMDTNRDYYLVEQDVAVAVGGKQDGDNRFDANKTLYNGPYEENQWYTDWEYQVYTGEEGYKDYDHFYGSWFDSGEYHLGLTGNGSITLLNAIPQTDNNNMSTSVSVGESGAIATTTGMTLNSSDTGKDATGTLGTGEMLGWTKGTSFSMTTTENVGDLKVERNDDGTKVQWLYNCATNMMDRGDNEHPLAPDALTDDVNIQNRVCWSVDNPDGGYRVDVYHERTMAWLSNNDGDDKLKGTCIANNEKELGMGLNVDIPNRTRQTWTMDVTLKGDDSVKQQLTEALQKQFPDVYQPTVVLADQTAESENTIRNLVDASKQRLKDSDAKQTLMEYGQKFGISQFTIKWSTIEGSHNTFEMTVPTKPGNPDGSFGATCNGYGDAQTDIWN